MKCTLRFVYIIVLMNIFSSCQSKTEPEIYLLPDGFTGKVNVVFNQNGISVRYKNLYNRDTIFTPQKGVTVRYENGRRVYQIPANGILLTQFKDQYGNTDREFYYSDVKGKRKKLDVFQDHEVKAGKVQDTNKVAIFNQVIGSYGNANIPYQGFEVSSYNNLANAKSSEAFLNRVKEVLQYDF